MDFEGNGGEIFVSICICWPGGEQFHDCSFFSLSPFINSPKSLEDVGLRGKWCIIRGTRSVHGWSRDFFCVLIRCCPAPGGQKNFA